MARPSPPADRRTSTLFWRVFSTNAVVITGIFLVLALTPATVGFPFRLHLEGLLSVAGLRPPGGQLPAHALGIRTP
ncbi:MAG: hypothetical protein M3133_07460 [Actinomycetota bacterium]|nr:hypothetical protein [Actinomycetota bacterium]